MLQFVIFFIKDSLSLIFDCHNPCLVLFYYNHSRLPYDKNWLVHAYMFSLELSTKEK